MAAAAATVFAALALPAFSGCSAEVSFNLKTDESGAKYYSVIASGFVSSLGGEVEIPEYYGEGEERFPVKEIEESAFANASISKVIIPATVEIIGTAAFAYNNYLEEVCFAEGSKIDKISWGLCGNCANLEKINIPATVTKVEGMSFYGCSSLKEIIFPAGVTEIGTAAFQNCSAIEEVNFPEGLTRIGSLAFYGCSSIKNIILPDGMHDETVKDDEGNESTISGLGWGAFHTCTSAEIIKVGEGITTIEEGVFGYCTGVKEIYLPKSLKKISGAKFDGTSFVCGHAFHNCTSLQKVYFAGTEAEWNAITIDPSEYRQGSAVSDNSAIVYATKEFGKAYGQS